MSITRQYLALTVIVLAAVVATVPGTAQTIVNGLNTYPTDQNNVQNALDAIVPGGTVVLQGTFNFGPDGSVTLWKKDVTLTGDGAVIRGGGTPSPEGLNYNFAIQVRASGVTVSHITFVEPVPVPGTRTTCAILAWVQTGTLPTDNPVVLEDNEISTNFVGIVCRAIVCPVRVVNNTIHCNPSRTGYAIYMLGCRNMVELRNNLIEGAVFGVWGQMNGLPGTTQPLLVVGNRITMPHIMLPTGYVGIYVMNSNCPIQIEANQIDIIADGPGDVPAPLSCGILVQGYFLSPTTGPDIDNAPVTIAANSITIRYPYPPSVGQETIGIEVGNDNASLSNALVRGNTLSGAMMVGLWREMYGDSIAFIENDLSNLKTSVNQLGIGGGRATTVRGNIFGFANGIPGESNAVTISSFKYSYIPIMPNPTEGCLIAENNYRLTGLPGWPNGGSGCISIYSMADREGLGTEVRNNVINETGRFPLGTGGPAQQIVEWKSALVHDNRIIGQPAAGLVAPGIGQQMKELQLLYIAAHAKNKLALQALEGLEQDPAGSLPKATSEWGMPVGTTPQSWALHSNYPNPFNPSTRIQYDIPVAAHVSLKIYNILGEEVASLFEGDRPGGSYTAEFDGSHLSSGIYLCRLCAGTYVATMKLMLVK